MEAERQNDMQEQERWRKRIFHYLDWLFRKDANAGADVAGLQVHTPFMWLNAPCYPSIADHSYQCQDRLFQLATSRSTCMMQLPSQRESHLLTTAALAKLMHPVTKCFCSASCPQEAPCQDKDH